MHVTKNVDHLINEIIFHNGHRNGHVLIHPDFQLTKKGIPIVTLPFSIWVLSVKKNKSNIKILFLISLRIQPEIQTFVMVHIPELVAIRFVFPILNSFVLI